MVQSAVVRLAGISKCNIFACPLTPSTDSFHAESPTYSQPEDVPKYGEKITLLSFLPKGRDLIQHFHRCTPIPVTVAASGSSQFAHFLVF